MCVCVCAPRGLTLEIQRQARRDVKRAGEGRTLRRSRAAWQRADLCCIMERMVRQTMREGARKWKGPRLGLVFFFFLRIDMNSSLLRMKLRHTHTQKARRIRHQSVSVLQSTGEACGAPRTGRSLASLCLSVSAFTNPPSLVPAGDVDLLAADKHNALTSHELLSDDGAEATKQVPAAVDHHGVLEHASLPVRHTHTRTITIGTRTAPAASYALRRSTHRILAAGGAAATPPPAAKIQLALLSSIVTTRRLAAARRNPTLLKRRTMRLRFLMKQRHAAQPPA
jgi:hypothetical protein